MGPRVVHRGNLDRSQWYSLHDAAPEPRVPHRSWESFMRGNRCVLQELVTCTPGGDVLFYFENWTHGRVISFKLKARACHCLEWQGMANAQHNLGQHRSRTTEKEPTAFFIC